ncbi:hypothetical protein ACS3UN_03695 [Oscillospiraceae bacterium LTW-04]|nr:hypothetical protein RBH76_06770 [Oscillospiraceae bacterium MB24-C1]
MNKLFAFLSMIFLHIVDDYYLQGWLANAKQKSWWEQNAPNKMYQYDYIWALVMHSFSWAFMTMLPVAFYLRFKIGFWFAFFFALNLIIHAVVDHLKANVKAINLWTDQIIHIGQIVVTFLFLLRT